MTYTVSEENTYDSQVTIYNHSAINQSKQSRLKVLLHTEFNVCVRARELYKKTKNFIHKFYIRNLQDQTGSNF